MNPIEITKRLHHIKELFGAVNYKNNLGVAKAFSMLYNTAPGFRKFVDCLIHNGKIEITMPWYKEPTEFELMEMERRASEFKLLIGETNVFREYVEGEFAEMGVQLRSGVERLLPDEEVSCSETPTIEKALGETLHWSETCGGAPEDGERNGSSQL
jgi:hypothetical protein